MTDNNISRKLFATTTTSPEEQPAPEPMDFFKEDVSKYVNLGQYKGLEVEVDQIEITQEQIDMQIDVLLAQNKQFTEVKEGKIEEMVIFSFDYTGYLANEDGSRGEKFEGGASTNQLAYIYGTTLVTISSSGTGSFIDGFAQGINGHNVGETFDIDVTFPTNYQSQELAGRKTIFEIKLNYIAKTNFTDEWVKTYSNDEVHNREELVEYIKDNVNPEIENTNRDLVWSKIIENSTLIEVPQQQLDYLYDSFVKEVESYVAYSEYYFGQQLNFDQVLYQLGFKNTDELKEYAKEVILSDLVVYAVIQAEKLEITDEEYAMLIEELVKTTGKTEAEAIQYYGGEESIKQAMLFDEADKLILKENNLVVKEK